MTALPSPGSNSEPRHGNGRNPVSASRVHQTCPLGRGIMKVSATLQQMPLHSPDRWRPTVTASRIPATPSLAARSPRRVIDYEPPPLAHVRDRHLCPPPYAPPRCTGTPPRPLRPVPAARRRRRVAPAARRGRLRRHRPAPGPRGGRPAQTRRATANAAGADADRRRGGDDPNRPVAAARPCCAGCACARCTSADGEATAAEMFATYTRGSRVRAIAGRVERRRGRWLVVGVADRLIACRPDECRSAAARRRGGFGPRALLARRLATFPPRAAAVGAACLPPSRYRRRAAAPRAEPSSDGPE